MPSVPYDRRRPLYSLVLRPLLGMWLVHSLVKSHVVEWTCED